MTKVKKKLNKSDVLSTIGADLIPPARGRYRRKEASLGATLATARVDAGMTQGDLAAGAGIGLSSLRKIEQGDLGVNLRTILKVVHFLDHELIIVSKRSESGAQTVPAGPDRKKTRGGTGAEGGSA